MGSARLNFSQSVLSSVQFVKDSPIHGSHTLDSEGLALSERQAYVSTETPPEIFRCPLLSDRTGTNGECEKAFDTTPFATAEENKGFESLCITPSGEQIVTATEASLPADEVRVIRLTSYDVRN